MVRMLRPIESAIAIAYSLRGTMCIRPAARPGLKRNVSPRALRRENSLFLSLHHREFRMAVETAAPCLEIVTGDSPRHYFVRSVCARLNGAGCGVGSAGRCGQPAAAGRKLRWRRPHRRRRPFDTGRKSPRGRVYKERRNHQANADGPPRAALAGVPVRSPIEMGAILRFRQNPLLGCMGRMAQRRPSPRTRSFYASSAPTRPGATLSDPQLNRAEGSDPPEVVRALGKQAGDEDLLDGGSNHRERQARAGPSTVFGLEIVPGHRRGHTWWCQPWNVRPSKWSIPSSASRS
jgi:hypothetical protein